MILLPESLNNHHYEIVTLCISVLLFCFFFSCGSTGQCRKTCGNNLASFGSVFMYCSYCAEYCLGEYRFCCLGSNKPREPDTRQSRVSVFTPGITVQAALATISPELICRTRARPETFNFAFNLLFLPLFGDSFVSLCSVKAQVPVK